MMSKKLFQIKKEKYKNCFKISKTHKDEKTTSSKNRIITIFTEDKNWYGQFSLSEVVSPMDLTLSVYFFILKHF